MAGSCDDKGTGSLLKVDLISQQTLLAESVDGLFQGNRQRPWDVVPHGFPVIVSPLLLGHGLNTEDPP